jgi:hypothetical protein
MNLNERIDLLSRLGDYMTSDDVDWLNAKINAEEANNWFTKDFIDHAVGNIARQYLSREALQLLVTRYKVASANRSGKTVGLVMAGNLPLVGFHDFLCIFLSGHKMMIKPSARDEVLIKQLIKALSGWDERVAADITFSPILRGADAYIATGSNNTGRYFDYYFAKYPHIIRRNRTSVAILSGDETEEALQLLADDVHLYFGMGCRNVTKLFVPAGYNFEPMLQAFRKYSYFIDHHKYKNNFEYYLAISLLNNQYYMTNGSVLLLENSGYFSPISVLHYEYYNDIAKVKAELAETNTVQCICGNGFTPFGQAQSPTVTDYADGVDTMHFLTTSL